MLSTYRCSASAREPLMPSDLVALLGFVSFGGGHESETNPMKELHERQAATTQWKHARWNCVIRELNLLPFSTPITTPTQVWPVYCHEETRGPYTRCLGSTRFCDSESTVECSSSFGGKKVVRLFPDVVPILRCLQQQVGAGPQSVVR